MSDPDCVISNRLFSICTILSLFHVPESFDELHAKQKVINPVNTKPYGILNNIVFDIDRYFFNAIYRPGTLQRTGIVLVNL